jgi:UDPglucose 6-dehydrogenase
MKICMIGTGYVGLVSGSCLADMGNNVICIDTNKAKIDKLSKGEIDIYEPGLSELVKRNFAERRLSFTTDLAHGVKNSQICFIAVGTPQSEDGTADLKHVSNAARAVARAMNDYKIIVVKSTVPVGSCDAIAEMIRKETTHDFDIVSNPEFLMEGAAIDNFMKPERVIVGCGSQTVLDTMRELYAPFTRTGNPILTMDIRSAEFSKYAANAILSTRISFMNEMANLCDRVGADIDNVRRAIGSDSRVGPKFLFPGVGFGGSCFPKDISALIRIGEANGLPLKVVKATRDVNEGQRKVFVDKIRAHFPGGLDSLNIAIWGLSFKPNTDDIREAPSRTIVRMLLDDGAQLTVFDPVAVENFRAVFNDTVRYAPNAYDALIDADALCLITEWNEFRNVDFDRMKRLMRRPVIFDGRNQYNRRELDRLGFTYYCFGRPGGPPGSGT